MLWILAGKCKMSRILELLPRSGNIPGGQHRHFASSGSSGSHSHVHQVLKIPHKQVREGQLEINRVNLKNVFQSQAPSVPVSEEPGEGVHCKHKLHSAQAFRCASSARFREVLPIGQNELLERGCLRLWFRHHQHPLIGIGARFSVPRQWEIRIQELLGQHQCRPLEPRDHVLQSNGKPNL